MMIKRFGTCAASGRCLNDLVGHVAFGSKTCRVLFALGFLDWLDDSTSCRCNAMVGTAWALKLKLLLPLPMNYDAHATPAHTHTHTLFSVHHTHTTQDLE